MTKRPSIASLAPRKVSVSDVEPGHARYERAGDVPSGSFAMETPSEDEVKRRAEING